MPPEVPEAVRQEVKSAIQAIIHGVVWKPGKDLQHLQKRKSMGHIPKDHKLDDYNRQIQSIISSPNNGVYLYTFGQDRYYGIVGNVLSEEWLVLVNSQGIMETAFPPVNLREYLDKRGFSFIGKVGEYI